MLISIFCDNDSGLSPFLLVTSRCWCCLGDVTIYVGISPFLLMTSRCFCCSVLNISPFWFLTSCRSLCDGFRSSRCVWGFWISFFFHTICFVRFFFSYVLLGVKLFLSLLSSSSMVEAGTLNLTTQPWAWVPDVLSFEMTTASTGESRVTGVAMRFQNVKEHD